MKFNDKNNPKDYIFYIPIKCKLKSDLILKNEYEDLLMEATQVFKLKNPLKCIYLPCGKLIKNLNEIDEEDKYAYINNDDTVNDFVNTKE